MTKDGAPEHHFIGGVANLSRERKNNRELSRAKVDPMIKTHAILCFIAWGLCGPLTIMIGNGFKRLFGETMISKSTPAWFALHQVLSILTTLLRVGD